MGPKENPAPFLDVVIGLGLRSFFYDTFMCRKWYTGHLRSFKAISAPRGKDVSYIVSNTAKHEQWVYGFLMVPTNDSVFLEKNLPDNRNWSL